MLDEKGVDYRYREYTEESLSEDEIRHVLELLGVGPRDVLRRRDKAFKELGLSGDEDDGVLIAHMAAHPTLLERPIGVVGGCAAGTKAAVGRPPDKLLDLC